MTEELTMCVMILIPFAQWAILEFFGSKKALKDQKLAQEKRAELVKQGRRLPPLLER